MSFILIVEPQAHIRRLIEVNLIRNGVSPICVADARSAFVTLEDHNISKILVAASLPDMSGRDLINQIRSLPHLAHIPCILIPESEETDDGDLPLP